MICWTLSTMSFVAFSLSLYSENVGFVFVPNQLYL